MSNRRQFLKKGLVAGLSASSLPLLAESNQNKAVKPTNLKHWVWINPEAQDPEADLQKKYRAFYEAGIRGIFFEADSEKHFRAAKAQKLEAHRWMWTMNRGEKELLAAHPEWYAVNRKGESCAEKPPYVDYYRQFVNHVGNGIIPVQAPRQAGFGVFYIG